MLDGTEFIYSGVDDQQLDFVTLIKPAEFLKCAFNINSVSTDVVEDPCLFLTSETPRSGEG